MKIVKWEKFPGQIRYYSYNTESFESGKVSWDQVVLPKSYRDQRHWGQKIIFSKGSGCQGNGKECLERPNSKWGRLEEIMFSEDDEMGQKQKGIPRTGAQKDIVIGR